MYYIITRRPGERTGPKPASCRQRALQRKTQPSGTERHRAQPAAKVRPAAHLPLRLCKTPVGVPSGTNWAGDSANRESSQQNSSAPFAKLVLGRAHRRAMRASRPAQPRSTHCRLAEAGGPDAPLGRDALRLLLPASTLSETSRAPGPKNYSAPMLRPTVIVRAPWEILPFQLIVETQYFPLKAWRADSLQAVLCPRAGGNWSKQLCVVWPISYSSSRARLSYPDHAGTALRPGRPRLRRGGAPIGRFIGHPAEKNGQRQPLQNARWAGPTEPGENPAKERITQIL